jgi:hypothetical protein
MVELSCDGQQIMVHQVLFRHGIVFEGPDRLLADRIGLQLLCRTRISCRILFMPCRES